MLYDVLRFGQFGMFAFWLADKLRDYVLENPTGVLSCLAESSIFVTGLIGLLSFACMVGVMCQEPVQPSSGLSGQQGWTIEYTYGGSWIVRNQFGQEIAGGMSEQDARRNAERQAESLGLPKQELLRIKHDWE